MQFVYQNEYSESADSRYLKKSFGDFRNITEALIFFDFSFIKEELTKHDETLLLDIQISGPLEKMRQNELQELSKKCRNKSTVILFATQLHKKFSIYWKSKDSQNFLTLSLYADTPDVNDKNFYDFVSNFLAKSLSSGHIGEFDYFSFYFVL